MRRVSAGWDIRDGDKSAKGILYHNSASCSNYLEWVAYLVKRDSGEEVLVMIVASTSPEVTNLLRLDVLDLKRRALQRRSGRLKDWQRGENRHQRVRDSGNRGDQRRQGELRVLLLKVSHLGRRSGNMSHQGAQKSGGDRDGGLHIEQCLTLADWR